MATIKLKKPAPGSSTAPAEHRAPLRSGGVKPARPTLAQAEAERARRRAAEQPPHGSAGRSPDAPARAGRPAAAPARPRGGAPASGPRPPERSSERPSERPRRDPTPPGDSRPARAAGPAGPATRAGARPAARAPERSHERPQGRPQERAQQGRHDTARGHPPERPPARPAPRPAASAPETPRLSKRMSELGLASRREADEWIEQGYVRVDGVVVDQLGARVRPEQQITIDPQAKLEQAQRVTVLLHKPLGYVSGQAEDGHEPAFMLVNAATRWAGDASKQRFNASQLKHLVPAGRLDLDSTGLLVLTQDGRIAKQLIGEDSKVEKEYVVRVVWTAQPDVTALNEAFPAEQLERLRHGLELDGEPLKPAKVSWQNEQQLRFVLREGKKRQIRRMCELVGLQVVTLKRIRIGRIGLGEMPPGQWRYLGPFESFL